MAQSLSADTESNAEDSELEKNIIDIFSTAIGNNPNNQPALIATTPLVEAGVDSLCAMRLLRDIKKQWPESTPTATIRSELSPSASNSGASAPSESKTDIAVEKISEFSSQHLSDVLEKLQITCESDVETVLPATTTQSQLAISFGIDRRNYVSHTVLSLKRDISLHALEEAISAVVLRQGIYRTALVPCDDSLSPFAQAVLTPEAWCRRRVGNGLVVRRTASTSEDDVQEWLDLALGNMDLDSQNLYHIQIVEPRTTSPAGQRDNSGLLVISVAHCICDGASLGVLLDDISRQYSGLEPISRPGIEDAILSWVSNVTPETDNLWQESLQGREAESFHALSGNNVRSAALGVPADHKSAMVQSVSQICWQTLENKSRALGGSPLSVLQAAWSLLLQIFSEANTGDIMFGSVLYDQGEVTHAPTFSVMPCRVDFHERQTIGQMVDGLSSRSRFAQSHHHVSFDTFKTLPYNTALALQLYTLPLEKQSEQSQNNSAPWSEVQTPAIRYDFDIFVEVFPNDPFSSEGSDQVAFRLTFRDDALSETSAKVITDQLAALTEIILSCHPDDLVQSLPAQLPRSLLSAEGSVPVPTQDGQERKRQEEERVEVLHAQFESQALATPDRLALSFYTSLDEAPIELSYGELDARADGLANILREEDVDIIPICMERGIELYVSILAILKAGSAWSPIDETSPVQRRTSLIARTESKVLLTTTESYALVEPCLADGSLAGVRVILVDKHASLKTSLRAEPRQSVQASHGKIGGQDLAYLLWTSGTTGEPKGVMVQHYAAANAMRDLQIQVEHDDKVDQIRMLQFSAYSFDVFVQDLFYTWGLAGSIIGGTRELMLGTFTDFVCKSQPTHAHLTPSFGASIDVEEIRGSALQYVTFIGEKLTEDVAEAWAAPGITTKAYNTYGPAENAVVSTMRRFYGKSRDKAKAANVGFPLTPCTAYVVREVETQDPQQGKRWELVPRYGVGELALGGTQVAKGYLNNEAKTTKAFIQGGPGIDERIYLTGDMVRLNDHGFEFLGRNDDLIKITGIRIELSEISAACAGVKDDEAAVEHIETLHLPRPGSSGSDPNHMVVVTFVSVKQRNVDTAKLRSLVFQKAKEMLPAYMIPGHVVVLDTTMPRTASNKADRKAMQAIYNASDLNVLAGRDVNAGNVDQMETTWTAEQVTVLETVAANFKVPIEPLSPDDSLAGLGFSSLQVTKLAWALRKQLECPVGALELMRCQTLGELVNVVVDIATQNNRAELTTQAATEPSWLASVQIKLTKGLQSSRRPQNTSYVLPATPVQESLIVETMLEPSAYWSHRIFELVHPAEMDSSRLKSAWTAAAMQFDILRTVFLPLSEFEVNDETSEHANTGAWARQQGIHSSILQLVLDEACVRWATLQDADDWTLARRAETVQAELTPAGSNAACPPWAVTFSEGNNKMMLSMHHALHDGTTSAKFLHTVAELYQDPAMALFSHNATLQLARGMELGLLPTIAQREAAVSAWSKRISDLVKTEGAVNAAFPDLTQSRKKQAQRILSTKKTVPTQLLERKAGLPDLPRLLQSAFGCVLSSYLELGAVVFGQTVSQRLLHPDLSSIVGPAMATVPIVVRATASTAEDLWNEMASDSSSLTQSSHRLHPVDIKKMINEGAGNSKAPFPALFAYHPPAENPKDDYAHLGSEVFRELEQALSLNVEHSLALNVFEDDNTIELTGDGRRISQGHLNLMLDQILDQAEAMFTNPKAPLFSLQNNLSRDLMSTSGKAQTSKDHAGSLDPTGQVALHASEHPDWVAAEELILQESEDGNDEIVTKTITYADLNALTNTIVAKLDSHQPQLQPDDVVALYLARDIKSLAATLAIFRKGLVYLPVDGDLPAARRQLIVRDAKAKLVISVETLVEDLDLDLVGDPPALLLPDGHDDIAKMQSWPAPNAQGIVGQDDGGYLLYTSGSTGRPKGVRVSKHNLCHFISAFSARLVEGSPATATLGGEGKYLNLTSRAFDPHITQLFVPWHLGYRVVIGQDRNGILGSLHQVINDLNITHFGSVPSVLTQLSLRPQDVPSVRVVTTGGEKASNELLDTWSGEQHEAVLFNFYGPTEVTIGCLGHAVNGESNARNLGLPLQGSEALLLVPSDKDEYVIARRGQPGELCIAGPQVAMGYLDRPEENARSFQSTTLLGDGGKKIYRTGDMMRMMHNGTLEFLGRRDQQAKIRGQRLEIEEVVTFLRDAAADEGLLDFAAAVVDQQLIGFVARKASSLLKVEADAEPEALQIPGRALKALLGKIEETCEEGLPAFMVPAMIWVSKIPYLTASGKVDTKILKKLAESSFTLREIRSENTQYASTFSSIPNSYLSDQERLVVEAIEEAIGTKVNATSTSSIQRLGIDSLSAVHLASILRKREMPNITVAALLSHSCTVGSLASLGSKSGNIESESQKDDQPARLLTFSDLGSNYDGLASSEIQEILPSLPLQAALAARSMMWQSASPKDQNDGAATADVPYVAQFNYRLSPGTDLFRWQKAAETVVASEAMLQTCFVQREDDGQILQVVLQSPPSPFDGPSDAADVVAQMSVRPPIRMQVLNAQDSEGPTVSLKIHHALFDGVAIDVLRSRLQQAYSSGITQTGPAIGKSSLQVLKGISNYCYLSKTQLESTKRSWQARLRSVQPCRVGVDGDNDKNDSMARSTRSLSYTTSELKARLQTKPSGDAVSVSTAFQLATALCLAHLTGQRSVAYGFVLSLRPLLGHIDKDIDSFIGPCLNTLVHALDLSGPEQTLRQLAQLVRDGHIDATQDKMPLVSVDKAQRWTGVESKLFDSLLSINFVPSDDGDTNNEVMPGRMNALPGQSKSDLALAIDVDLHADGKIVLNLSSAGSLTESQLYDVGALFDKIVASTADDNATVGELISVNYDAKPVTDEQPVINSTESRSGSETHNLAYKEALKSVQRTACRLLRLDKDDLESRNDATTSLYQIGLDSITILPFVKLINKSENTRIGPNAVMKARTLQGAAKLLAEAKIRADVASNGEHQLSVNKHHIEKGVSDQPGYDSTLLRLANDLLFVATPLQEGMLSASMAIEDQAYVYTHTVQLSEDALSKDTDGFEHFYAAVKDTMQACEILRTRFIFTQDDHAPWVGAVSPTEQSDLVKWEGNKSGLIRLRIHHALYDANSIQAVWQILGEKYGQRLEASGENVQESTKFYFHHFARASFLAQKASVEFWSSLVQDYNYSPVDVAGEELQASSVFHFDLQEQDLLSLKEKCRTVGVTIKTALQLAWAKVLCEAIYGQTDVVFGEVISAGNDDHDGVVVGPTINTIPMRVKLADQTSLISVNQALTRLQSLSDEARGTNAMASLRLVQTLWRSSCHDQQDTAAGLFQSLFVFDGVSSEDSKKSNDTWFVPAKAQTSNGEGETDSRGPSYDDYPFIVSFRIKNGALHGKLRAKAPSNEVDDLGRQLETSLRQIIAEESQKTALDRSRLEHITKEHAAVPSKRTSQAQQQLELNGLTGRFDSILELVKQVLGTRSKGKGIGYNTKLVNVGLDSILAIRLSKLLKQQIGINASVFKLIKGATVQDIAKATSKIEEKGVKQGNTQASADFQRLTNLAAVRLGLAEDAIKCISPVLPGQRGHLQQWLHNGKRFFEAPWVYRITDETIDAQKVATCWTDLCQAHDILRTTFICREDSTDLAQVTFKNNENVQARFTAIQDSSISVQALIENHVREENNKPSDFTRPPARLSFLDASDGKAIILRAHHALYDAWSIKMIERDLMALLSSNAPQSHPSIEDSVQQMAAIREPDAEIQYWQEHLRHAQATLIQSDSDYTSRHGHKAPLGSNFKATYQDVVPREIADALAGHEKSRSRTSASIILAYARALRSFTGCHSATFGLYHASRSLSSVDGQQTLDLTPMSIPTMTVAPLSLSLDDIADGPALDIVQDHLAQLTRFSQAPDLAKVSPKFNTYLNILYPGDRKSDEENMGESELPLKRYKLSEPLASEYFTTTKPSSTISTIEALDTSDLCAQQLFFNVIVRPEGGIGVNVSGSEELLASREKDFVAKFVGGFSAELVGTLETS